MKTLPKKTMAELVAASTAASLNRRTEIYQQCLSKEDALKALNHALTVLKQPTIAAINPADFVLLVIPGEPGRYPAWQFDTAIFPYMSKLRYFLRDLPGDWVKHDLMTWESNLLGDSPVTAFRAGQHQQALAAVAVLFNDL